MNASPFSCRDDAPRGEYSPECETVEALVARAQSGEEAALEELLRRFAPLIGARVRALWTALQGSLSGIEWDDVQSQVRLSFLLRLRDFEAQQGVYFAHYIARFLELDGRAWLRAQRRRDTPFSQIGGDENDGEYSRALQELEGDDDLTARLEQVVSLRAALATLTPAQHEVVWRCCVLQHTEAAAACALDISRSAVRSRLESALHKLRAFFCESGESAEAGLATLAARTGRAAPREIARQRDFWIGRQAMAKDEKRPDLVGIGVGRPVLLQGVFDFPATGLRAPQLLSPKLCYTVPPHCVVGVRYFRIGIKSEGMACVSTVVNGDPHRLVPVAANSTIHVPFAIVEPIIAGSQIEIHIAADAPGIAIIDIGCLQMPV